MSDEPQLLAVNLVRSSGLPALTGHYLVEMLPQADLLLAEEHFAASGRQVLPISNATYLEPGDLLGVEHALWMRAPIAVIQSTNSAPAVSPPTNAPEVAAISDPSRSSCSHGLTLAYPLERLTPEQRVSFLRVWHRLPKHLREITFDSHDKGVDPCGHRGTRRRPPRIFRMFFPAPKRIFGSCFVCLNCVETSHSFKQCSHPFINASGCINPELGQLGTTAPRTAAGKNACCATAAATKQEDPEPALARAATTGQAGNTDRVSHTNPTPATMRKTLVPEIHSRSLTAPTVKTPIASHNYAPISSALHPYPISYALLGSRGIP